MKTTFTVIALCLSIQFTLAQFNYISPKPGSQYHNPKTNIILKNGQFLNQASVADKNLLEIVGSISGNHSWTARLSDDRKTVVINPIPEFAYGETVSVTVHSKLRREEEGKINGVSFSFSIRNEITAEEQERYKQNSINTFIESFGYDPTKRMEKEQFETPDSFPAFTINVNNNPSPGRIFYCNQQELDAYDTNSFPTIIENDGTLVFARDEMQSGHDFKLNQNGYLSFYQYSYSGWKILDSNFNEIDSIQCGNGYELETNGHDFQMLSDGHYLLLAFNHQTINMTAYGGVANADVQGLIVQEMDANKEVIFEWRSWDHFLFTDANMFTPLTNTKVDYVHGNSVERDNDGNLMISCRSMDELTKINRETGDIIWRMGGENNQFSFVNDNIPEHFRQQHDVRRIANGNITILNNGNYLPVQVSSAKEYHLDEVNKIATLIWFYEHPDIGVKKVYARGSGNVQRLPNGNTMISWGTIDFGFGIPNMTEVDANKNIVWEMTFDQLGQKSYRTFKFDWNPCSRISEFTMKVTKKPSKIILSWQPSTGALNYKVSYRQIGASTWITKSVKAPKLIVTGLLPATTYEWNVKTICQKLPLVTSTYSETKTFSTSLKLSDEIAETQQITINAFPVPASEYITLEVAGVTEVSTLVIRNLLGQLMYEKKIFADGEISLTVDVAAWTKGLYVVNISGNSASQTQKFIVD